MFFSIWRLLMTTRAIAQGVFALLCVFGLAPAAMAQASALSEKAAGATSASQMLTIAQQKGYVRVIVMFESPTPPSAIQADPTSIANIKSQVAAARSAILSSHFGNAENPPARGFPRGLTSFPITAGFAINVTAQELEALGADSRVLTIQHDRLEAPSLNESVPLIGMPTAYAAGALGTNQTVVVLDTGVKSAHEFLSGKVIAEACFSNANGGGGGLTLCPNGGNSQIGAGSANPNATNCNTAAGPTAFNLCYHGTHVAGIASGFNTALSGTEPPNGVAKASKIFAIQVFTRFNDAASCNNSPPCVLSFTSDQISALNHVFSNLSPGGVPVASVNMSLGGGLFSSACDNDSRKGIIDSLRSVGVLTAIASGNNGSKTQINAPGCISTAVTVGSTSKTDVISSFSNMSSVVDVLAPGGESGGQCTFTGSTSIVGPVVLNDGSTNGYGCLIGTSMATPHVAGAIATIKSRYPGATAAQIATALVNTGLPISDTRPGGSVTRPRIRVEREAQQAWWTWGVAGTGDFNHDGKSDILWRGTDGSVAMWLLNGGVVTSGFTIGVVATAWSVVGVGDFNADGTSDILWRNSDGTVAIWLMNGANPGAILSAGNVGVSSSGWSVVGVGKFFGANSKADILWRNVDGTTVIWRMNGLAFQSASTVGVASTDWSVAGVGDFNGDGTSDILWRNMDGTTAMWLLNNGAFASGGTIGVVASAWTVAAVRDFSGEGRADIFWRNTNGMVATWLMNGGTITSAVTVGSVAIAWNVVGNGSFDGVSGDILWRNTDGSASIWFMNNAGGFGSSANLGVIQ